jgi:hypothetical protein
MKKKTELDVDFIGGQDPLTVEEEKALSDFFTKKKLARNKNEALRKKITSAKRVKLTT